MGIKGELIGIRMYGPPPIGLTEVTAIDGFTVLGGVNGAGKSTLLAALGEAISGDLQHLHVAELIFHLFDSAVAADDGPLLRALGGFRAIEAASSAADFIAHLGELGRESRRDRYSKQVAQEMSDIASEIQGQCVVSLILARHESGRVGVLPTMAGRPTDQTPHLIEFLARETQSGELPVQHRRLFRDADIAGSELISSIAASDLPIPLIPLRERPVSLGSTRSKRERLTPYTVEVLTPSTDVEQATADAFADHADRPLSLRYSRYQRNYETNYNPEVILRVAQSWTDLVAQ